MHLTDYTVTFLCHHGKLLTRISLFDRVVPQNNTFGNNQADNDRRGEKETRSASVPVVLQRKGLLIPIGHHPNYRGLKEKYFQERHQSTQNKKYTYEVRS